MDSSQSQISIANAVAVRLGNSTVINSLNPPDPNNKLAAAINLVYPQLRDYLLGKYPWTFAQKTITLTTLSPAPTSFGDGISIAYAYPQDFIKTNKFNFPHAYIRLESTGILSDTLGLMMKYTFANDDPTTYSPDFITTLVTLIASKVCYSVTNGAALAEQLGKDFEEDLQTAISSDSQGGTADPIQQDEWEIIRMVGGNTVPGIPGSGEPGNVGWLP
jgi:hypothetical protein